MFETFLPYMQIVAGCAGLLAGGEFLVSGAVCISKRLGLSAFFIGLTVISWTTSAPEIAVSIDSVLQGAGDLTMGNIVGSNTANILLVLALTALVMPIAIKKKMGRKDIFVMVGTAIALLMIGFIFGEVGRVIGFLFLAALFGYLAFTYLAEKRRGTTDTYTAEEVKGAKSLPLAAVFVVGGIGALVLSANWLVSGATTIAENFGVSQAVIGLTVVAVGTSLPEVATCVISAFRGHSELAVGNIVGTNIFNILGVLGLTAAVKPLAIHPHIMYMDIPFMILCSVALAVMLLARGKISRLTGAFFLVVYVGYVIASYMVTIG
ncbi:MAG: calcium/sodium antiporter [Coriobacteriia bacterium]|nr:calcium/sodium antiporter [Coriobacteriia bacterium]